MCYDTHIAMRGFVLRHTIFDSKIRRSERLTFLPDEYTGSRYTYKLMGTLAKAKTNAAKGILELLEWLSTSGFRKSCFETYQRCSIWMVS